MSFFSKIKQFFSGPSTTQLDNAAVVAPYKVEMPVLVDVAVAAPASKPTTPPAVKKAPAKKQQVDKKAVKAVPAGPAAMKVPAVKKTTPKLK